MTKVSNMHPYLAGLTGGLLLGAAAVGYLYIDGRILGISGMISQCLNPDTVTKTPALPFFIGMIAASLLLSSRFEHPVLEASLSKLILAGFLVGFGTRLGSGCTSGHGICGLARWSPRSMVAVATFMTTGFITVFLTRHVLA